MQFTALQIATLLKGKLVGEPEAKINQVAKIEEAKAGSLSFVANPKYEEYLYSTDASIIIINEDYELKQPVKATLIRVKDAYSSFAYLLEKYNEIQSNAGKKGIEQPSYISKSASIGKNVYVGSFTYIGDNVLIGDNVKIYPGCYIGDNVVINEETKKQLRATFFMLLITPFITSFAGQMYHISYRLIVFVYLGAIIGTFYQSSHARSHSLQR